LITSKESKKAMLFIVLGVILLGTGPMFVKFVHANGVLVGFYRLFFASIMLSVPACLIKTKKNPDLPAGSGLKWAVLGGLIFALNISLWCSALNYTTASAVTLLDNTAPVWVGLITWILFKEKHAWRYWLGLLVTIGGAGLMIGWDILYSSNVQSTGNLIGIASGFSYALYILVTQQARRYMTSLRYSWIVSLSGAAALLIVSFLLGLFDQSLPLKSMLMIFLMALSSQVIAWLLVNHALGKLPAVGASVALVGQPVVTTLLGIFILNEIPSPLQLLGAGICLTGIILVQRSQLISTAEMVIE
jgi:drug/metabolite transporter (DMT)-like permease